MFIITDRINPKTNRGSDAEEYKERAGMRRNLWKGNHRRTLFNGN